MHTFVSLLRVIGPIVLAMNPATAPYASDITAAAAAAEDIIKGPNRGGEKLDHVIKAGLDVYNRTPLPDIDAAVVTDAVRAGMTTTVDAIKVIQGLKVAKTPVAQTLDNPTNPAPSPVS